MRMISRMMSVLLAILCVTGTTVHNALAQVLPDPNADLLERSDLIGVIPGTNMQRDEFRARGDAQLTAVALNALVHRAVHGEYPGSLLSLQGSDAWNLQPLNMFTGEPIQPIFFEPTSDDMTMEPFLDIPFQVELPNPAPLGSVGQGDINPDALAVNLSRPLQQRVDPLMITHVTSGDVYYYANGDLLQLILYAPDGTYVEHVDPSPHLGWRARMNVGAATSDWPFDLYLAQLLQFCDVLMPNLYNYVMYMSDGNMIPHAKLEQMGAEDRILMCSELGINLRNPLSHSPLAVEVEPRSGNFIAGSPLGIAMRDGEILTQAMLDAAPPISLDETPPPPGENDLHKPREKPQGRPPLGGRR